jgi:hypothetical protein
VRTTSGCEPDIWFPVALRRRARQGGGPRPPIWSQLPLGARFRGHDEKGGGHQASNCEPSAGDEASSRITGKFCARLLRLRSQWQLGNLRRASHCRPSKPFRDAGESRYPWRLWIPAFAGKARNICCEVALQDKSRSLRKGVAETHLRSGDERALRSYRVSRLAAPKKWPW